MQDTYTFTNTQTLPGSKSVFWHMAKTEVDSIHCGNDREILYMRHHIEFWCWDFSALTALSASLFLFYSLSNTLTSLHPLPHHMPKATKINMIGPSHTRRRAVIWTGMTRGKWNWFQVYQSVWVYVVHLSLCVLVVQLWKFKKCDEYEKWWRVEQSISFLHL